MLVSHLLLIKGLRAREGAPSVGVQAKKMGVQAQLRPLGYTFSYVIIY